MNKKEKLPCPNFPFFGAQYADAGCFDGYLRDLDDCDDNHMVYEHSDNFPCPFCNTEAFIKRYAEYAGMKYKDVRAMVKKLKEKHQPVNQTQPQHQ